MKTYLPMILLIQCWTVNLQAQIWEKFYLGDFGHEIFQDASGKLKILTCDTLERKFLSIDTDGQLLGEQDAGDCLFTTFDGGFINITSIPTLDSLQNVQITKYDADWQIVWNNVVGSTWDDSPIALMETRDSGIVAAIQSVSMYNANSKVIYLFKFDKDGALLWNNSVSFYGIYPSLHTLTESKHDSSILMAYNYYYVNYQIGFKVFNSDGTTKFAKQYYSTAYGNSYSITEIAGTTWGGTLFKYHQSVYTIHYPGSYHYDFTEVFNQSGSLTSNPKYAKIGAEMDDGGTVFCQNNYGPLFVTRVSESGDTLQQRSFQGDANDIIRADDGSFFITGKKHNQTWLMKLDSLFRRPVVECKVFWDENQNCQYDPGEVELGNRSVSVYNSLSSYSARTDGSGISKFEVSPDSTTVAKLMLENGNWTACWDSVEFQIANYTDTVLVEFPVQIFDSCSPIRTTLGANLLSASANGGANTYDITVVNNGLLPIKNAVIKFTLDQHLSPSNDWPFTHIDSNLYSLNLGTLSPLHTQRIQAKVAPAGPDGYYYCSQIALETGSNVCPNARLGDQDCQPLTTLDNWQTVYPPGETDAHFIAPDTKLEYKIKLYDSNVGQYGGVTIYDTLSPFIDTSSFVLGASPYLFTAQILNDSVIQFYCPALTNYVFNSNGVPYAFPVDSYVKFSIYPKADAPDGTVINSKVGLHYTSGKVDFTNEVFRTISSAVFSHAYHSLCKGGWFEQNQIFQDTVVLDTFAMVNYDSIVLHHLHVLPTYAHIVQHSICEGDSIEFGSQFYNLPGAYIDSMQTVNGCDSIVTLQLTVFPPDSSAQLLELCQGETSPLTGEPYPMPGTFSEQATFQNQYGCDSIVTATLTVHPEAFMVVDNGPLPYGMVYNGVVLTQDTQFVYFDTTEFGCLLTISENVWVLPSAVSEHDNSLNLRIFPNPTSENFTIEMDLPEAMALSIEAVDRLGRRVAVISENAVFQKGKHEIKIDFNNWLKGIYMLQFRTNTLSFIEKIIKE